MLLFCKQDSGFYIIIASYSAWYNVSFGISDQMQSYKKQVKEENKDWSVLKFQLLIRSFDKRSVFTII